MKSAKIKDMSWINETFETICVGAKWLDKIFGAKYDFVKNNILWPMKWEKKFLNGLLLSLSGSNFAIFLFPLEFLWPNLNVLNESRLILTMSDKKGKIGIVMILILFNKYEKFNTIYVKIFNRSGC